LRATGIVRKIDELGRIVIPVELRRVLTIDEKDSLEIFTEGESIILKKYAPSCILCGEYRNTASFKGKKICRSCIESLK